MRTGSDSPPLVATPRITYGDHEQRRKNGESRGQVLGGAVVLPFLLTRGQLLLETEQSERGQAG